MARRQDWRKSRPCDYCGKTFKPTRENSRFCTGKYSLCRVRYHNEERRDLVNQARKSGNTGKP